MAVEGFTPPEFDRFATPWMRLAGVAPTPEPTGEPLSHGQVAVVAAALLAFAAAAGRWQESRPPVDLSDGVSPEEVARLYSGNEGVWDIPHQ